MGKTAPSNLDEAKDVIERLPSDEFAKFQAWFAQFAEDDWDRQIAEDVAAGRLDHLAEQVRRDVEAGRYTEL